jgi:hypothetical protein
VEDGSVGTTYRMEIGIGTLVVILLIIVIILFLRRA